ncbi:hypothetical protein BVRB_005490 [Beta vulgaris subsp. vulgaris]|uniref:Uncharacterized protein n=1 Tax=Beta vulgaris subsp. vulgaris TaxID=3555 RepID=A0A0J8B6Z1_BETVV|nr:hypothetical protein BVRB_005490 [Beta vulgaris subsp. vulgaris]
MDFGKLSRASTSPFDCLMFDLDDTLYSSHTGIHQALKKNIEDFLVERCGFSTDQAASLRVELFKTYGSTLAGLRALGYDIDADDYHSFVHGRLPYAQIKPNPQLRNLLCRITQRKIIFTNSDRVHATKALSRLGLEDCFEQIICFETLNPNLSIATRPDEIPVLLKPSLDAIAIAISAANITPHRTLFLDDNVRNVAAGKALGLKTALVGRATKCVGADYALETVNNLAQAIPDIVMINGSEEDDQQAMGRSMSDLETFLTVGA